MIPLNAMYRLVRQNYFERLRQEGVEPDMSAALFE
jgi:hypothetical protein